MASSTTSMKKAGRCFPTAGLDRRRVRQRRVKTGTNSEVYTSVHRRVGQLPASTINQLWIRAARPEVGNSFEVGPAVFRPMAQCSPPAPAIALPATPPSTTPPAEPGQRDRTSSAARLRTMRSPRSKPTATLSWDSAPPPARSRRRRSSTSGTARRYGHQQSAERSQHAFVRRALDRPAQRTDHVHGLLDRCGVPVSNWRLRLGLAAHYYLSGQHADPGFNSPSREPS